MWVTIFDQTTSSTAISWYMTTTNCRIYPIFYDRYNPWSRCNKIIVRLLSFGLLRYSIITGQWRLMVEVNKSIFFVPEYHERLVTHWILLAHHCIQYIPRNMHTVFALLCFVVVIHWLIFPYPWGLLHWHCGNLTIAPVPAKQPWWIWTNTSGEFIMSDCITTTKQSTTKPCAYFLGYTVGVTAA